jgi:hypothetical protein
LNESGAARPTESRSSPGRPAAQRPITQGRTPRRIETIYQDLALANNLDVGANIFFGREVKTRRFGDLVQTLADRHMREQSRQTLDSLQIRFPSLTAPIEKLSGGQRQAVGIARAVYWDARLMIMDEPTNNLGVPEQHKVLELIRMLKGPGVPVILITHMPDGRTRRHRPHHRHAPRPKGHREAHCPHQRRGVGAVHGWRAGGCGRLRSRTRPTRVARDISDRLTPNLSRRYVSEEPAPGKIDSIF